LVARHSLQHGRPLVFWRGLGLLQLLLGGLHPGLERFQLLLADALDG
jgi:hypothetical protein